VLNTKTARSQFLGGIVQGIGAALLEQTRFDTRLGNFTNVNFAEYLCPVNADIRNIEIILVPEEDKNVNPIGAKGLGEICIVGVTPAIANAVYHATGKRVRDLPITLDCTLAALGAVASVKRPPSLMCVSARGEMGSSAR